MQFSEAQRRRYARNMVLPEIGKEGQEKLLNAKILVVGAGGLGSPALLYLAAAGVGRLGIVDADRVELSNLQRQVLFETADEGRHKTESARDALLDLNPDITVDTYPQRIDESNAQEIISRYDIVADGSDNFATRFLLNETCFRLKKTLVSGAAIRLSGQLSTFKAYEGNEHPCYQCFCPEAPPQGEQPSCADNGILGAVTGVIGSMMAIEVIKEIVGAGETLSGKVLRYDALSATFKQSILKKDPECPLCGLLAKRRNIA